MGGEAGWEGEVRVWGRGWGGRVESGVGAGRWGGRREGGAEEAGGWFSLHLAACCLSSIFRCVLRCFACRLLFFYA